MSLDDCINPSNSRIEIVAKPENPQLVILLAERGKVLLDAVMQFRKLHLKQGNFLIVGEFELDELEEDGEGVVLHDLVGEFGVDESVEVGVVDEPVADLAVVAERFQQVQQRVVVAHDHPLPLAVQHVQFVLPELERVLLREGGQFEERFH